MARAAPEIEHVDNPSVGRAHPYKKGPSVSRDLLEVAAVRLRAGGERRRRVPGLVEHIRLRRRDVAVDGLEVQPTDVIAADMLPAVLGRLV